MCHLYFFSMKVKYKEEYEKNKGKSMLEFVETPSYQVSKEAQKMQSEVSLFCCQLFSADLMFCDWKEPLQWLRRLSASGRKYTALARPRNLHCRPRHLVQVIDFFFPGPVSQFFPSGKYEYQARWALAFRDDKIDTFRLRPCEITMSR